jgi:hypothetical protein
MNAHLKNPTAALEGQEMPTHTGVPLDKGYAATPKH